MKNKFFRTFAVTLATVLCFTAFSTTAFAGGADPDPAPLPEETGTPTTGGIELDTEDAEGENTASGSEDTESTGDGESSAAASSPIRTTAPPTRPALSSRMEVISTSVPARGQTTKPLPSFPTGRRWK